MKRLAFIIAVLIGLNTTSVARRPEEEEGQAIVQHDAHPNARKTHFSVIQTFKEKINVYFYAITWEGIFHKISWDRIAFIMQSKQQKSSVTTVVYSLTDEHNKQKSEIIVL